MNRSKKLSREEQQKLLAEKEKNRVEYNLFQKVILDFQLKSHEKFLKTFLTYFRLVDKDNNGIVDEVSLFASSHLTQRPLERVPRPDWVH